jgi:Uma2 family endonuclease
MMLDCYANTQEEVLTMALPAHMYQPRSPAPWAEAVPGRGPATVDELLTLPDDGYIYEVVEGVLVRMAGSGDEATGLGVELVGELRGYVRPRRLGRVTGADGVYKFPGAETGLVPDVGFYVAERRAQIQDRTKPIPFAPDLAVEVASPDQSPKAMAAKARRYLAAGTRLVWVVWPQSEHIDVWHSDVLTGPVRALTTNDSLNGEDVIPGFSYPVADLFRDPLAPEQEE